MTKQEWLACADLGPMLEFLRGKASDRKLRLFSAACCRRIWHFMPDEQCRMAVEVAEKYADGLTSIQECEAASRSAGNVSSDFDQGYNPGEQADYLAHVSCFAAHAACIAAAIAAPQHRDPLIRSAAAVAATVADAVGFRATYDAHVPGCPLPADDEPNPVHRAAWLKECALECGLLRDLFGNPFRPVTVASTWLTSTAVSLATAIYNDRAFDRLPILADALEDAGCDNADILNHCRQPGEHVLGCWAVDLVLGKQ